MILFPFKSVFWRSDSSVILSETLTWSTHGKTRSSSSHGFLWRVMRMSRVWTNGTALHRSNTSVSQLVGLPWRTYGPACGISSPAPRPVQSQQRFQRLALSGTESFLARSSLTLSPVECPLHQLYGVETLAHQHTRSTCRHGDDTLLLLQCLASKVSLDLRGLQVSMLIKSTLHLIVVLTSYHIPVSYVHDDIEVADSTRLHKAD